MRRLSLPVSADDVVALVKRGGCHRPCQDVTSSSLLIRTLLGNLRRAIQFSEGEHIQTIADRKKIFRVASRRLLGSAQDRHTAVIRLRIAQLTWLMSSEIVMVPERGQGQMLVRTNRVCMQQG